MMCYERRCSLLTFNRRHLQRYDNNAHARLSDGVDAVLTFVWTERLKNAVPAHLSTFLTTKHNDESTQVSTNRYNNVSKDRVHLSTSATTRDANESTQVSTIR